MYTSAHAHMCIYIYIYLYLYIYIYIYYNYSILYIYKQDVRERERTQPLPLPLSRHQFTPLDFCLSSLRRGHADLLRTVIFQTNSSRTNILRVEIPGEVHDCASWHAGAARSARQASRTEEQPSSCCARRFARDKNKRARLTRITSLHERIFAHERPDPSHGHEGTKQNNKTSPWGGHHAWGSHQGAWDRES